MTGRILAICRSDKKGTPKVQVDGAELVADHGIAEDAHAGPGDRQVSLLDVKDINKMRQSLPGLEFGVFAENIALEGIDCSALGPGSRLRLGATALIQITQIGKVCHKRCAIFYKTGDCIMPRSGLFGRVLEGGVIAAGDPVDLLEQMDRESLQAVILIVLDRYSGMDTEDATPAISELLKQELGAHVFRIETVPDQADIIAARLKHYSELHSADLALTIGGTGFFPSNSGFNSVRQLIRLVPAGLEQSIKSLYPSQPVKEENLRGFRGLIHNRTIIVSLPGPQSAALENLTRITPALERTLRRLHRWPSDNTSRQTRG